MRIGSAVAIVAAGLAIAATATGITYAATSSSGGTVHACADAKGVLALLNSHGHCPKHFVKVAINEQGPRGKTGKTGKTGPAGPGAISLVVKSTSGPVTKTSKKIAGSALTVQVRCNPVDNAQVYVNLDAAGTAFSFEGTGSFDGLGGSGSALWLDPTTGDPHTVPLGASSKNLAAEQAGDAHSVEFTAEGGTTHGGTVAADLLFTQGSHMFSVELGAYQDSSHCFAHAMVTPAG